MVHSMAVGMWLASNVCTYPLRTSGIPFESAFVSGGLANLDLSEASKRGDGAGESSDSGMATKSINRRRELPILFW